MGILCPRIGVSEQSHYRLSHPHHTKDASASELQPAGKKVCHGCRQKNATNTALKAGVGISQMVVFIVNDMESYYEFELRNATSSISFQSKSVWML